MLQNKIVENIEKIFKIKNKKNVENNNKLSSKKNKKRKVKSNNELSSKNKKIKINNKLKKVEIVTINGNNYNMKNIIKFEKYYIKTIKDKINEIKKLKNKYEKKLDDKSLNISKFINNEIMKLKIPFDYINNSCRKIPMINETFSNLYKKIRLFIKNNN